MKDYTKAVSYRENGFVHVENVVSTDELKELRQLLNDRFKQGDLKRQRFMELGEMFKDEIVYRQFFQERLVSRLKEVMGNDLWYIPDFVTHHSFYGVGWPDRNSGWHIDCGFEFSQQSSYLFGSEYQFAKVGIYLQDWDNGWGGGILAMPGSHKWFYGVGKSARLRQMAKTKWNLWKRKKLGLTAGAVNVPTKAGDAVFFDARMFHQASLPADHNIGLIKDRKSDVCLDIPPEHTKYVLYVDACSAAMVRDHMVSRMIRSFIHEPDVLPPFEVNEECTYTRHNAYHFPDDYPAKFVRLAQEANVSVATFHRELARFFKLKTGGEIAKVIS